MLVAEPHWTRPMTRLILSLSALAMLLSASLAAEEEPGLAENMRAMQYY